MRRITSAALFVLVVGAVPAVAQRTADTTKRARFDSAAAFLPELSVLAGRLPRNLFTTPLAVTTVQSTDAFGTSGYGLNDALSLVPGVLTQSRSGNQDVRLVIRGFGARGAGDRSNAGTSRGIRILLDGVPETEPDGRTSFDGIDVASATRIEVIRSNASSLWGNAAGGVVNVSTMPDADSPGLDAQTIVGGFGLRRYIARMSTAVGRSVLWGSFVQSDFAGWRASSASRRSLANVGVLAAVGDKTSVGIVGMGSINQFRIPGPLTAEQLAADPRQANPTYQARDERRSNRVGRLGITVSHNPDGAAGVSGLVFLSPKVLQRSERGTFRDFTRYHVGGNIVGHARVAYSPSVRGRFSAGLDEAYQDGAILFYGLTPDGNRGDQLRDNKREGANNLGAFLQHDLEIGDGLMLSLGARYDAIRYHSESYITPSLNDVKAFTRVTPKVGVVYRVSPTHSVYANLGGGVEAPAGNETDPAGTFGQDTVFAINPLLDPIRSTTYEVGTKQAIYRGETGLLRTLSYDVAAYVTKVQNEIVPYRGGRFYFTAGRARRSGAELGVRAGLAGGVSFAGAFTVAHNTYTQYQVDSVHYGRPGRFADYSGNKIVGVPDVIVGAQLAFEPASVSLLRLQLNVDGNSAYFADDANVITVGGYTIASVTAGLRRPVAIGRGVALGGFVTVSNLFSRNYLASAFLNPDIVNGTPVAFEPGLPRQVLLSLRLARTRP